jgi:putative two-component system response regulator
MATHPQPRALIVDDDARLLASFRRILPKSLLLETAEGPHAALEALRGQDSFAVVVSDINMPDMDGIAFLEEVKRSHPDTVRMVLTGHGNMQNAVDAVNKGYVFRFLLKPISPEDMQGALADGLAQFELIQSRKEVEALRKMRETLDGLLVGLTTLIEARDPYTAGHQFRVAQLSTAIAHELAMEDDRVAGLRIAALVHDIGKVYVPAEFLNKPGRLSDGEFNIIKAHPQVGYNILHPINFPWPIAEIVLQHHERLDGQGYPRGLAGEAIMPEARVIAVADVVDAMASHRPYRSGLGLDKALAEVSHLRGAAFDPRAVDACLALFKDKSFSFETPAPSGPSPYTL